jgi:uncharacterized protein involved in exopolysaccharide biosynthesis
MNDSMNFLRPYLRGWPILLGGMFVAFWSASQYLKYVTPMYESTAKLRLADMTEGVSSSNLFKDLDVFANTQKINAEIELLKSHALISKALAKVPFEVEIFRSGSLRKTELYRESPIVITPLAWPEKLKDKTFLLTVHENHSLTINAENGKVYQGALGDTIAIENGQALFALNKELLQVKQNLKIDDNYEFSILSHAKQMSQVSGQIDIMAVDKDVPVIRISFKSSNAAKAAELPNAIAEAYIEDYIENKYGAANVTVDFLNERIAEISQKLSNSEQMILGYRDSENITNIRQETETDLRKIAQLKIQHTNLKMNLEAIRDLERYIQSGKNNFLELAPNFEAFTDLLSTEMVKSIKKLQAEKKDLLLQYTEKDEKVMVIDEKLNDLSAYLIESISNTRKNLQTKLENLDNDIASAEKVFVDVPEKERMMTILNREFEIFQQSYNILNQKKIEAEIAKAAKIAFHRIITPAFVSKTPVSPNTTIIKIVSTILGLLGAIMLIYIVHALKARVNNVASVEAQSMIPVVASVPKLKTPQAQEDFFIKTFRAWELKDMVQENEIICFTGFQQRHGSAFISAQIMKTMNLQKKKTLLITFHDNKSKSFGPLFEELVIDELSSKIVVSNEQLNALTTKALQDFLKEKAQKYDYTLLVNSNFGASHTLASMAASNLNIVCLDTRLTPAKLISEVDLMQQEYQMPKLFFALNRVGYNPSIIRESMKFISKIVHSIKPKKNDTSTK